ncbi:MAG: hypothetical protein IKC59_03010 [Clostridia bacterium]|nr:hypothetical protein [Clostridia bacterium]
MPELNQTNLKVFARLIKNGFSDEQRIANMGIADLLKIPKITPAEIQAIDQFQKAIRAGNTLSFFIEEEHHEA